MYSHRHKKYNQLMDRIHNFNIKVKRAERQLRKEDKKKKDPFEAKEVDKTEAKESLGYVEEGSHTKHLAARALRGQEAKNDEE